MIPIIVCARQKGYSSCDFFSASVLDSVMKAALAACGMAVDDDLKKFWKRWRPRLSADDPFTNPNLDIDKDDWSINAGAVGTLIGRIRRQRCTAKNIDGQVGGYFKSASTRTSADAYLSSAGTKKSSGLNSSPIEFFTRPARLS